MDLYPGQSYAITGPSGSGKSTLLNILGGLESPSEGEIRIRGKSLFDLPRKELRGLYRTTFGFLFQNYALVEQWTVYKNLRLALRSSGVKRSQLNSIIDEALFSVGMEGVKDTPIYTLSGGEQQRIALARLIACSPSIVLADEPTAALDGDNADLILRHLSGLSKDGALIVCTTHSDKVASWADQVVPI